MVDGFLGRWSQRKQAARSGRPLEEADLSPPLAETGTTHTPAAPVVDAASRTAAKPDTLVSKSDTPEPEAPAPPTMQDVAALHADSDFTPFVARAVAPEVRNAAMKKLFADPHFNVMDGLDTYIDDYTLPDPLPATMLRKMASAKFMQLFDDDAPVDGVAGATGPGGADSSVGAAAQGDAAAAADTPDQALANPAADVDQPPDKPEPDGTDIRT